MQPGMSGWRGFIPPSLPAVHDSSIVASVPIVSEDTDLSPDSTTQDPAFIFPSTFGNSQVQAMLSTRCTTDHRSLMTSAPPLSSLATWFQFSSSQTTSSLRETTPDPRGLGSATAPNHSAAVQFSQTVDIERSACKQNSNMAFAVPGFTTSTTTDNNRYNTLQCRVSSSSSCSSNSPGIKRKNSVASSVKTSISTDEEMRSNPNTPNLLPHSTNATMGNVFNFDPQDFPGGAEDLDFDLDLDLDNDDDVFSSDIGSFSAAPLSTTSNYPALAPNDNATPASAMKNRSCPPGFLNANTMASSSASPSINTALWSAVLEACRTDQILDNNNNNVETDTCELTDPALLSAALELHLGQEDGPASDIQNSPFLVSCQRNDNTYINTPARPASCNTTQSPACCPATMASPYGDHSNGIGRARTELSSSRPTSVSSTVDISTKPSGGDLYADTAQTPDAEEISSNPALLNAALEAVQSGQITPLLKHELKWVIQLRRLSQGKEEMEVNFDPPTVGQMSDAEMSKAERRRKQNRIAARKFRQKRKSVEDQLLQTIQTLKETNSNLAQKAEQLRGEKQALLDFIQDHLRVCPTLSKLRAQRPSLGDDAVP